ncbi:MAG TPA: insulinase family protein [Pedobacter sp.]
MKIGADLNAKTSFDETIYELPIPTDDISVLRNGMQIIRDLAQDASLDSIEIEKERGVVLEEKRSILGASQRMANRYLPVMFNNSRYSNRIPIGTEEVLTGFKHKTLKQFYKDWYRPDLQALIVVGDINVAEMEAMVKNMFSDLKMPASPLKRTEHKISLLNRNQSIVVTDKEFPYTVAQIFIKHPKAPLKTIGDMRDVTIRSVYNKMMGARFSELMKQTTPPFLHAGSSIESFYGGLEVVSTQVVAKPGELENGLKAALSEIERVKLFGFTGSELDRAKQSYLTSVEASFKEKDKTSSEKYVREYVRLFLNEEASPGIEYQYNFSREVTPTVTLAEVNAFAKRYLVDANRDVLILAPEKDAAALPSETTVSKWISEAKNNKLTAYVDEVSDKPLMSIKPVAGKVVSETRVDGIGVTELKLSNGVKVILKPTNFKNNEIKFNAFSKGGTSLYPDSDFQSADFASEVVTRAGLGEFNPIQLPKLLAGKQVYVSPYISELTEGINGSSAPKDLETALQLTHLYFTAPRKDAEILKSLITQIKGVLSNRSNDPNSVFSDTVSAVLGNNNIRRTCPNLAKLEQVNLDKAYNIYRERFANGGDFTFTFVGSFKIDEIKPLLEQYLGSLPTKAQKENFKDLGIIPPTGKINKFVYKGQEPKATVRIVFSGDYNYNEETNNQLTALGNVLQIKLIERLREEESGVYSPAARMSYTKYPRSRYSFSVSFGCSPDNVDKLVNATLNEINKIKVSGAQASDLERFFAEEGRSTETKLKQNDFWLSYLSGQYQTDESPNQIVGYLESLKNITSLSLKTSATRYLNDNNQQKPPLSGVRI